MKIFYGVQATGNGHISRARVMAKELYAAGLDVQFQFTGRPAHQFFDMGIFKDYQLREGLTLNTDKGQLSYFKTVLDAKPITFIKDIKSLNLKEYDVIISDFEPVTAWAGKLQNKPVLGLGNQYAYSYPIPKAGTDPMANLVMKYFAPANKCVGLHWHHFGLAILPPITESPKNSDSLISNKIMVYLPFEDQHEVIELLSPFTHFNFHLSSPQIVASKYQHITCKTLSSHEGFQKDLSDCAGIISNAGFALTSEALQLGKKILIKPLHGQMEQVSNVKALQQLGYAHAMMDLDRATIEHWLQSPLAVHVTYPNVAKILVQWIQQGMPTMSPDFIEDIWKTVDVMHINHA